MSIKEKAYAMALAKAVANTVYVLEDVIVVIEPDGNCSTYLADD